MANLLIDSFTNGFFIPEFVGPGCILVENALSVKQNIDIVKEKIESEILAGRIAGPFDSPPFLNFRISPLALVPKKEPNSFRLIHNLSYPKFSSLNDEMEKNKASVKYSSFDQALSFLQKAGRNSLLAKADIKSAFRLLPINPIGYNSLGFYFLDKFFYDMALPMGFTLSCFYFEAFSTFLHWVMDIHSGSGFLLHYLDDFLFIGREDSDDCMNLLNRFIGIAKYFCIPLAVDKTVYPTTNLKFLGIDINTVTMEFSIPMEKIQNTVQQLTRISGKEKITLKQLQSLLGSLNFISRVIPMGRVFSKRLYAATSGPSKVVWIFGDELIQLAERRSAFRHSTVNLGYSAEFSINWFSFADLKISDIFKNVSLIYSKMSKPDLFILHIGSFDLGKIKTHLLIYELKELLCKICYLLDGVVLVFSDIIPKFSWFNSELSFLETIRKRINKKMEIYLKEIGHGNYRHVELEGFVRGLYQEKDDQLSDIGCDIFISDLQNIIDNGFY
ncbi:uncharacterized protein LOC122945814 isoform X1 [Bufo gargarizans]|nr:uncharacterized protein LOC122926929 isoform X1 [Bufo gargarizans]XP_044142611.1 uncharacterized protein LOC122932322 isoform X1 [Bufo gargarizans]XP_044147400.1 uncharacterized protein LOC122935655 [Bufo gargarizans]XP_044150275.1 uncharacterized protein LOC122938656 [Bufo gargarizans]XP_044154093.1 uncharacterized protein LOC122941133 isoform X1 [Bufo gargarizans]XP_044154158.1 uncharacterized protein LOC122941152 isoform X1 [Bufo gargarizans]XP_044160969.1 uncharacterized protein LOC122